VERSLLVLFFGLGLSIDLPSGNFSADALATIVLKGNLNILRKLRSVAYTNTFTLLLVCILKQYRRTDIRIC